VGYQKETLVNQKKVNPKEIEKVLRVTIPKVPYETIPRKNPKRVRKIHEEGVRPYAPFTLLEIVPISLHRSPERTAAFVIRGEKVQSDLAQLL